MPVLNRLLAGLAENLAVIDLTAPLSEQTPVIRLPSEYGQPQPFTRETISCYDERGPDTYWSNIRLSEHTGTHFDAPVHWISGRDGPDVAHVPLTHLIGPAVVLDFAAHACADHDFLLEREDVEAWEAVHGPLPDGSWLLYRTGWDARADDPQAFLNDGHTPGVSPACARWLAEERAIVGLGVETVGTDAGQAGEFTAQRFPCHWHLQGSGKYGLTQLRNLRLLPPRGAVIVVCPLPIVGGSGSPARVLALTERGWGG